MSRDRAHSELALYQPQALGAWSMEPTGAEPVDQQQSLWRLVDDRLRGRWIWMILVGVLLWMSITGFKHFARFRGVTLGAVRAH